MRHSRHVIMIEEALKRSDRFSAISVNAREGTAFLTATVRILAERDDAERAAWAAPGVTTVDDRLLGAS
jgi:osmotically-inducible protein OsmY